MLVGVPPAEFQEWEVVVSLLLAGGMELLALLMCPLVPLLRGVKRFAQALPPFQVPKGHQLCLAF